MRLCDLAPGYQAAAERLQRHARAARQELRCCDDPQRRADLRCEIHALGRMIAQCHELAELTAHYYERNYYRDEKYTL